MQFLVGWRDLLRVILFQGILVALAACEVEGPAEPAATPTSQAAVWALPLSGPIEEAPGRVLYIKQNREFWLFEPGTAGSRLLAEMPEQSLVGTPAVSPDGHLIAYSLYRPSEGEEPGGSDLYLMESDGSNPRLLLAHDESGSSLNEPVWGVDGESLYFTSRSPDGHPRIERVGVDGGKREILVEGGHSPTLSADGRWLAYLTTDDQSGESTLWLSERDGKNPRQPLEGLSFLSLRSPRFSPSGERIAFVAVGEPGLSQVEEQAPYDLLAWMRPRTARAHGLDYNLWVVSVDGLYLNRLTGLREDSPVLSWSPDGKWLALGGELGLYLVDHEGAELHRVTEEAAWGGISWLP